MNPLHEWNAKARSPRGSKQALARHSRATAIAVVIGLLGSITALATERQVSVAYQPMVSTGLAAQQPFEAWFILDKSSDPYVPGYAVPAGATIRFVFPKEFTPRNDLAQTVVMLYGWSQGSIPVKFMAKLDEQDLRTLVVQLNEPIVASPPERPGLKAIHVRMRVLNPASAGNYPVAVEFTNAGELSGSASAIAHITPTPMPNVAEYNELNHGRGANWRRVKAGKEAPLPIDFLVTIPQVPRSTLSLAQQPDGSLRILSDGKPIGSVRTRGVALTLTPENFGPGYSRLGIIRVRAKAGNQVGMAEIIAELDGGTQTQINLIVSEQGY